MFPRSAPGVNVEVLAKQVAEAIAGHVVSDPTDAGILWATLPTLHEDAETPRRRRGRFEYLRDMILRSALVGPRLVRSGDVMALMNTANEVLTLRPILEEIAHRHGGQLQTIRAAAFQPSEMSASWKRCSRLEKDLLSEARAVGFTVDSAGLRRRLLKSVRAETLFRQALHRSHARVLLVSNQHLSGHRAVIRLANNCGIPSLYVPHAPVAHNDMYRDLPVNSAALRGDLEVDYYSKLGAPRHKLHGAGNPSVPLLDPPSRLDGPIVLALSPWPHDRMRAVINLVRDGIGAHTNIVVAPHPRNSRREVRRLLPDGWSINAGRTLDLLAQGPRLLIQHSSGIAWESLYLGIPTVQIQVKDEAPNYPLIAEPFVQTVRSPQELHEAMTTPTKDLDRADLRDWAHRWCATVGDVAAKRVADLIEDMPQDTELILDAWSIP